MKEVSIIINGVRYDAVVGIGCFNCDLFSLCDGIKYIDLCTMNDFSKVFKKSDKKFEV